MGKIDRLLIILVLLIFAIGLCFLYSATKSTKFGSDDFFDGLVRKQVNSFMLATLAGFLILLVSWRRFIDWAYVIYFAALVLLVLVLAGGNRLFGAQRWFTIFGFTFQPSEFAKLAFILAIARYLGERDLELHSSPIDFIKPFLISLPAFLLIALQPDLGTALVLIPILCAMVYVRGGKKKYFAFLALGALLLSPVAWHLLKDYQRNRLLVFINPSADPLGAGYTIIQSKIAIGSGFLTGKGWLSGTQNQLNFLPERHTDFIFSVVGEEWGFFGAAVLILLFVFLIKRLFIIISSSGEITGRLVGLGIIAMLGLQILVNIAMTIGLMPVVGLPLPLVSYGGSSLFTTIVGIALIIDIGRRRTLF